MDPNDTRTKNVIELTRQIYNCTSCQQLIVSDYFVVGNVSYHQACFNCQRCGKWMQKGYHNITGVLCCPQCYRNLLPVCSGCKKPIETKTCVVAEETSWHYDCFQCTQCKSPFKEGRYYAFGKESFCFEHYWVKKEATGDKTLPCG